MGAPVLHLLVGPNGAGKTTLFQMVLEPATGLPWINADDIAGTMAGDDPERAYEAARRAGDLRADLIARRTSFATETVFSHPSKVELVREAVGHDYLVTLHVVLVPEELAVSRVESRVEHGGHDVPEAKVRTRHRRLWSHVADAIALAHETFVYDNTTATEPYRLVARFEQGRLAGTASWPAWTPAELRSITRGPGAS